MKPWSRVYEQQHESGFYAVIFICTAWTWKIKLKCHCHGLLYFLRKGKKDDIEMPLHSCPGLPWQEYIQLCKVSELYVF